jgi:nucleosome assembly protein 1-like 1
MIFELVKEKDEEILKHVNHVHSERGEKPKTLSVKFDFTDNEFFENKDITLKVIYKGETDEVSKIEGTQINWKEGKDPTKKKVKKK